MVFRVEYLLPHLGSVIASLVLALLAWKRPRVARGMFVVIFAAAAVYSMRTAIVSPDVYLTYAQLTDSAAYRRIILGPFAARATFFVAAIAASQGAIAIGLCLRGVAARVAAYGAIVFFVSIAPLGVGSGLPTTVIMACAMGALLRHGFDRALFSTVEHSSRQRQGPSGRDGA